MGDKIERHHGNLMRTIVTSDIFGRTAALERLGGEISQDALILDPYDSEFKGFKNEKSTIYLEHENFAFIGASRSYLPHDALRLCFHHCNPEEVTRSAFPELKSGIKVGNTKRLNGTQRRD